MMRRASSAVKPGHVANRDSNMLAVNMTGRMSWIPPMMKRESTRDDVDELWPEMGGEVAVLQCSVFREEGGDRAQCWTFKRAPAGDLVGGVW